MWPIWGLLYDFVKLYKNTMLNFIQDGKQMPWEFLADKIKNAVASVPFCRQEKARQLPSFSCSKYGIHFSRRQ